MPIPGIKTKESGTLVAYLCDVGPLGLGKLVSLVDPLRRAQPDRRS